MRGLGSETKISRGRLGTRDPKKKRWEFKTSKLEQVVLLGVYEYLPLAKALINQLVNNACRGL